jgi:predicted outer membrane repeat protein
MNATYGGAVYLNFSDNLVDKDVFVNITFISLHAIQQGGAIYTKTQAGISLCKFANNSAGNNQGNDVYAVISTTFYSDPAYITADCSVSLSPGRILLSNGVCEKNLFIFSFIYIFI